MPQRQANPGVFVMDALQCLGLCRVAYGGPSTSCFEGVEDVDRADRQSCAISHGPKTAHRRGRPKRIGGKKRREGEGRRPQSGRSDDGRDKYYPRSCGRPPVLGLLVHSWRVRGGAPLGLARGMTSHMALQARSHPLHLSPVTLINCRCGLQPF